MFASVAAGEWKMRWYLVMLLVLMSNASLAGPPSFCTVDHSAVARLICADEELWTAEQDVFGGLNAWRSNVEGAERDARNESHGAWIRSRNESCGLNAMSPDAPLETLMAAKPCMLKSYKERIEYYNSVMWN
jgi:hypothetical protein